MALPQTDGTNLEEIDKKNFINTTNLKILSIYILIVKASFQSNINDLFYFLQFIIFKILI